MSEITEKLCGHEFSAQTVSNLCKNLYAEVEAFRNRPLDCTSYPFLIADATYVRMHSERGCVISVGLFIVIGVRKYGLREVLSFSVSEKESEDSWKEVFQTMKERGLKGVQLITSDAHCGIQNAIMAEFPGAGWQRCQTHFSHNILDACPSHLKPKLNRLCVICTKHPQ